MKFKIRITRQKIILSVSILLLIFLIFKIYPYIQLPTYSINYFGTRMNFRINLKDAKNVLVYPDEESVKQAIMNQVENITIVFRPGEGEVNSHYAVEVFEIVNKLAVAYKINFGYIPSFNVVNVTNYENLEGKPQNPIIALIHPIYSNNTSVRYDSYVVYIQGKNSTNSKEQLKNFDLAVTKFLIVTLDIKI